MERLMVRVAGLQPIIRLFLVFLMSTASIGMAAAQTVTPPSSRIALTPPAGFIPSQSFQGFENREIGASIGMMEFPAGAFNETTQGMTSDALSSRGLRTLQTEPLKIAGMATFLVRAEQQSNNVLLDKWLFIFDAKAFTGMVVVTIPRNAAGRIAEPAVRAALASVRVDTAAKRDPRALLPYVFDRAKRFQYENVMGGQAVLLKESPPPPKGRSDDAAMLISYKRMAIPRHQHERLGELAISSIKALKIEKIISRKPVTVGGLPGYEFRANAKSSRTEAKLSVVMVALFSSDHYYILMGFGEPPALRNAMADIQAVIASFRVKS
jgi:hypothetical protein